MIQATEDTDDEGDPLETNEPQIQEEEDEQQPQQVAETEQPVTLTRRQKKLRKKRAAKRTRQAVDSLPQEVRIRLDSIIDEMRCSCCSSIPVRGFICHHCGMLSCQTCILYWKRNNNNPDVPKVCYGCKKEFNRDEKYTSLTIMLQLGKNMVEMQETIRTEIFNLRCKVHRLRNRDALLQRIEEQHQPQNNGEGMRVDGDDNPQNNIVADNPQDNADAGNAQGPPANNNNAQQHWWFY